MPGAITHLIVQQRLNAYLRAVDAPDDYITLLEDDPCSPYAAFGSIGPDFLFFSTREYGDAIGDLTNFIFNVYDALEPLIQLVEDFKEQVIEPVEDALSAFDQALFQGVLTRTKNTADQLSHTAHAAAAAALNQGVDLFFPFQPKVQRGAPENEWYWFDFLHYRRTGRFASEMWNLSGGDPDLQRYVLGYVSHIGTDVVGHPFVNAITGGPFRTHWHRHKLVENWIDAYARRFYPDGERTLQCLDLDEEGEYVGDAISGSYYYQLVQFPAGRLPQNLTDMFLKALDNTYGPLMLPTGQPKHPPMLNAADLDDAYRLWLMWFQRSTEIGDVRAPSPPSVQFGSATQQLINDYVSGLPPFPGPPGPPSGGFSLQGILAGLLAAAQYLGQVVAYTFDFLINNIGQILTLPFNETLAATNWLLYQIQKGLWAIYDNLRFMLVLGGYLFPEPRDLGKLPWGRALTNTSFTQFAGGGGGFANANFLSYPAKDGGCSVVLRAEHHLNYPRPSVPKELEFAEPMPFSFHGVFPEDFISRSYPLDPYIENLYDCTAPYGTDETATHYVDERTWETPQFGSALDFSARLIARRLPNLPNFNLDGDRGYGWKTWQAEDGSGNPIDIGGVPPSSPISVQYVDPNSL